jgi:hypothetical protein
VEYEDWFDGDNFCGGSQRRPSTGGSANGMERNWRVRGYVGLMKPVRCQWAFGQWCCCGQAQRLSPKRGWIGAQASYCC